MSLTEEIRNGSPSADLLQDKPSASGDQQDEALYKATQERFSHSPSLVDFSTTLVLDGTLIQPRNQTQSTSKSTVPNYDYNKNYNKKRKQIQDDRHNQIHGTKRMKCSPAISKNHCKDRVIEWIASLPDTSEEAVLEFENMSDTSSSNKRSRGPDDESIRSDPTYDSRQCKNLVSSLGRYGIVMQELRKICKEEKTTCETYLQGDLVPEACLMYPHDIIPEVIWDTRLKLESHVQRDILPWTVPSIYNLCKSKEWDTDYSSYDEQVDTIWINAERMGNTLPKPDYVAGLSEAAFNSKELDEITDLQTARLPFRVSAGLILPYLVCEAKSGTQGLVAAEFQNTHAGGILVRTMFELYMTAYQKSKPKMVLSLSEKIIVWTMDINHESVKIWGHYGVLTDATDTLLTKLLIYRYPIRDIRLAHEAERFIPYNFVRNIYKDFVPIHINRIRNALKEIRENQSSSSLSFATSGVSLNSKQSPNTIAGDGHTETSLTSGPSKKLSSAASLKVQLTSMIEDNKAQREENKALREEMKAQRQQSDARLEQQREESKAQMDTFREMMDLLKQGRGT